MKYLVILFAILLTSCASDPVLYDGQRHVVIYCAQSADHVTYLESEMQNSKNPEFVSKTKDLIYKIKFSCP